MNQDDLAEADGSNVGMTDRKELGRAGDVIIFDMDGVILDSEPQHERAFLEVCKAIGLADTHGFQFSDYVGRSDAEFWTDFMRRNKPVQRVEELQAMKRERVLEGLQKEPRFYPGLLDLVRRLSTCYRLGLASGSERLIVEAVLRFGNLQDQFEIVVTSSEVPLGKPQPDIFLKTASLMGVEPANCWVIEDSKPGVAAGLAAGMRVIAVTNTHPAEELRDALHVFSSCAEIEALLMA